MSLTINQALAAAQLDASDARALLRHVLGTDDVYLISHGSEPLPDAQSDLFSVLVSRRRAGEPIAYITGTREFFSLAFQVTPAVLIPRPETELLVEFALECIAPEPAVSVLDLGTGSGCIAISIARQRPRAQIIAVDASPAALTVARDNAQRLLGTKTPSPLRMGEGWDGGDARVERDAATPALTLPRQLPPSLALPPGAGEENVQSVSHDRETLRKIRGRGNLNLWFVRSDWFSVLAGRQFDLIVANPPYVAADDPHLTGELRFEPQSALVAGDDGLACIRLIVAAARQYLNPGGWLAFEHGYDQSAPSRELLAHAGYARVFSRTDLAGIERLSGGQWNA